MATDLHPLRAAVAIGAALALTLAACGGDDDGDDGDDGGVAPATTEATPTSTDPPASDEGAAPATTRATPTDPPAVDEGAAPAMQPSSITFDAQDSDGTTITVAAVELSADGFVAVHGDADGAPGPVIGVSELLPAGTSTDIVVTLTEPLTADATLFPMVHIDTDSNGRYEFGSVEGVDGPGLTADGDVAVTGNTVTLGTGGDEDASGADAITIANFSFDGVTEVAVDTTVVVTNTDGAQHTWSAVDGSFDSGALGQNESFEFTFAEPGSFDYFCNFHPSMTGTIVVTG